MKTFHIFWAVLISVIVKVLFRISKKKKKSEKKKAKKKKAKTNGWVFEDFLASISMVQFSISLLITKIKNLSKKRQHDNYFIIFFIII